MDDLASATTTTGGTRTWVTLAILAGWVSLVTVGMGALLAYSFGSANAATSSPTWPEDAALPRSPGVPTLVVVLHPKCPCSRATVTELARLMTHARGPVTTHVLVVRPEGTREGWERTDLWRSSEAIPGVAVHVDPHGDLAARFGARASGHALLFDGNGALLFSGGITSERGHEGDSAGQDAVLAALAHESSRSSSPVFGCPLRRP